MVTDMFASSGSSQCHDPARAFSNAGRHRNVRWARRLSRGVKPQLRGKPSGRPFGARFADIAQQAGLREPMSMAM